MHARKTELPGSIIGYRKDGRPIRLQAGGDPTNDPADDPTNAPAGKTFTEDEVNRLLSRERDKLHGRLSKTDDKAATLEAELKEMRDWRAEQEKAARKLEREREAARKAAEEAELSARELIERRTAEFQQQQQDLENKWAGQVSTLQEQMAQREALFQKEREFQELANYAAAQVNANSDKIAPELIKYVGRNCNTREEIDASVADAIETTSAILAGVQQAQQAARSQMPGVSTGGFTPAGAMEGANNGQMTAEQIAQAIAADPSEYARLRMLPGMPGSASQQRGILG